MRPPRSHLRRPAFTRGGGGGHGGGGFHGGGWGGRGWGYGGWGGYGWAGYGWGYPGYYGYGPYYGGDYYDDDYPVVVHRRPVVVQSYRVVHHDCIVRRVHVHTCCGYAWRKVRYCAR